LGIKEKTESLGFEVVYGDTDSIFMKNKNANNMDDLNQIIELAKTEYGAEFSKDKTFKMFNILSTIEGEADPSQKQHFGLLEDGKVDSTTLIGMKSNYPKYCHETMWKLIDSKILKEFYSNENLRNSRNKDTESLVANVLHETFNTLNNAINRHDIRFIIKNLGQSQDNDKPLSAYPNNGWQKQVFQEILEDCNGDHALAERKAQAHAIIPYWKIIPVGEGKNRKVWATHPERYTLDKVYYKNMLWGRVKPILDSYLFTKEECRRLQAELVGKQ
jgi:DNA polymerase elongation subunit (family B)